MKDKLPSCFWFFYSTTFFGKKKNHFMISKQQKHQLWSVFDLSVQLLSSVIKARIKKKPITRSIISINQKGCSRQTLTPSSSSFSRTQSMYFHTRSWSLKLKHCSQSSKLSRYACISGVHAHMCLCSHGKRQNFSLRETKTRKLGADCDHAQWKSFSISSKFAKLLSMSIQVWVFVCLVFFSWSFTIITCLW